MKKEIIALVFLTAVLIGGCSTWHPFTKQTSVDKLAEQSKKIDAVKSQLSMNSAEKAYAASTFAAGTDRALSKVTNAPVEVRVAQEMNDRVLSILGNPYIDDQNKIKKIVDALTSQIEQVKMQGEKELAQRDIEVADLQVQRDKLKDNIKTKVDEYNTLAEQVAHDNDKNKAVVDQCNSWFGLGAVFYGLKRFVSSCLIFLLIGAIVFLAIKILANSFPPLAAAMGIFNMVGSLALHTIKSITPGAFKAANFIPTDTSNKYKEVLIKMIDVAEEMKSHDDVMPDDKDYMFKDYIQKINIELGDNDKDIYNEIKKILRWR
jgi:hypothetical protein